MYLERPLRWDDFQRVDIKENVEGTRRKAKILQTYWEANFKHFKIRLEDSARGRRMTVVSPDGSRILKDKSGEPYDEQTAFNIYELQDKYHEITLEALKIGDKFLKKIYNKV